MLISHGHNIIPLRSPLYIIYIYIPPSPLYQDIITHHCCIIWGKLVCSENQHTCTHANISNTPKALHALRIQQIILCYIMHPFLLWHFLYPGMLRVSPICLLILKCLASHKHWLVISIPLKNMKVSWGYYSQYMESHKIHVPNH